MRTQFRYLFFFALVTKRSYFTIGQPVPSHGLHHNRRIYQKTFKMDDNYVELNGIPTRILTFGKWIEEPFKDNEKELVLCITGNPGMPGFYISFATALQNNLQKKVPVWVIGHAGHDEPSDNRNKQIPAMKGNEDKFLLQGQVKHKIEFIEKYIPADVKLHLIGHSVGAWTILQLLKIPEIHKRVHHSYMLFPTIERMKDSLAGERFEERLESFGGKVIMKVFHLISVLPYSWRSGIVRYFINKWNLPESYLEEALKNLRTTALERMLEMGRDQVQNVYDLEMDLISKNVQKMTFYYGTRDHWVPTQYYHDLKERIPGVDAHLDTFHMAHAFNIRQGPQMAEIVAAWISNRRPRFNERSLEIDNDTQQCSVEVNEANVVLVEKGH